MEIALNGLHTRVTLETSNKRLRYWLYVHYFMVYVYNRCVMHHTKLIYFFHFFQICDIAYTIQNLRDMQ